MWLSGWTYRKKITISGSSGAGTGYQVLLKVGESSGASGCDFHLDGLSAKFPSDKNDSGDLRFTDNDRVTLLPFWVEKVEGTSPNRVAYVWVKVADNLDNNVDIYCYYGNASASNVSSVSDTFIREIDGVVGSWHFDEGSGTTAYDTSGNNNDGTINGATWVDGKFGKALSFDGNDDYVEVPDNNSLDITDKITIETWAYASPPNKDADEGIVGKGWDGGGDAYNMEWDHTTAGMHINLADNVMSAQNPPTTTGWHYIVGTYDGSVMKLYIDGCLDNSENLSVTLPNISSPVTIGAVGVGSVNDYFNGTIDEVHIYNKALTADEISDLYNNYGYTTENYPGKVLVRKRVDPEPAFSSAGATESVGNAIFMGVNF